MSKIWKIIFIYTKKQSGFCAFYHFGTALLSALLFSIFCLKCSENAQRTLSENCPFTVSETSSGFSMRNSLGVIWK